LERWGTMTLSNEREKAIKRASDAVNKADREMRKTEDRYNAAIREFRQLTRGLSSEMVREFTKKWAR